MKFKCSDSGVFEFWLNLVFRKLELELQKQSHANLSMVDFSSDYSDAFRSV